MACVYTALCVEAVGVVSAVTGQRSRLCKLVIKDPVCFILVRLC